MPNLMRKLFTLLLTAAVLLHATLGCCLHHVHAGEPGCHGPHAAATYEGVCEHHVGAMAPPTAAATERECVQRPAVPHGNHGCDEGKCSFARTEISPDTKLANAAALLASFALPACCVPQLPQRVERSSAAPGIIFPGALRLHLALAVLLI